MKTTLKDCIPAIKVLCEFMSNQQRAAMPIRSREEGQFFKDKIVEMADLISNMPETYGQDGKGNQAIAYLHYFKGGMDWYITEKDCDPDGDGQIQAFGLANLGYGSELGYISISELIRNNIELDLYFDPCTLSIIKSNEIAA